MDRAPVTVVEFKAFLANAKMLFSDEERDALIEFLSYNPMAGVVIKGTGGIRKLRWGAKGKGKSGGARAIYFYHDDEMPLFLLTAYGKNQKADIEPEEKAEFRELIDELVSSYRRPI
ncbi:MAG TPA: type II toxin-antitoxin system RelE/ParE family toxin [Parvibaculum sp.]